RATTWLRVTAGDPSWRESTPSMRESLRVCPAGRAASALVAPGFPQHELCGGPESMRTGSLLSPIDVIATITYFGIARAWAADGIVFQLRAMIIRGRVRRSARLVEPRHRPGQTT